MSFLVSPTARATLGQLAFDRLIEPSAGGMRARFARRAWRSLRNFLVQHGDPDVMYVIRGRALHIPLSHELPFYRTAHPEYGENIGRIAAYLADRYPELTLIDIGANVGDTVAFVRNRTHSPILCVEGDPRFYHLLQANVGSLSDVVLVEALLDERSGTTTGCLVRAKGTARLTSAPGGAPISLISLPELLAHHPEFARAKLIKLDTDGMDGRILMGSLGLLNAARPVIFFEYDPDLASQAGSDLHDLLSTLRDAGYQHALAYENTGEYMYSLSLGDHEMVEDFHNQFVGRADGRYADLCVFHAEDDDLWHSVRASELTHFRNAHSNIKAA